MKTLLMSALMTLSLSASAIECITFESQVMGLITKVEKSKSTCLYNVKVDRMNEHALCPLFAMEIERAKVEGACSYDVGDTFYRIIVKDYQNDHLIFD
jgi:hypothetical protein